MSKKSTPTANNAGTILEQPLVDILSEKYLSYALSTIMSRSLPDVRDGLKPVHRRLLFAMNELSLKSSGSPKKSARVVGDVIGKFHPHGDQSVYDALVRLAQEFAVRYPLVDGQGNFGNIDGDNAAAMRYTEARLTPVAELLLEGLDEDAVDFRSTYDGETREPIVMPAGFPNLLANGSSGIAVGMATNIPPHNVAELCEAMEALIEGDPSIADIVKMVPGPDFPTGGILVEDRATVVEAYSKGRGSFRLRAKWEQEDLKGGGYQIIVTEIPYQVQKAKLVEDIANLLTNKKLTLLDDVRDESAEDVRLVLVPKSRNVEPALMMEQLFRATDLEIRFSLNMNVLDGGRTPRVMNLKEVLQAFLNHRQEVLQRRARNRLGEVERRLEILAGYLIAYLNLDKVIKIIRTEDEPKEKLIKAFKLTDNQADAILNMRLRNLRKLEEMEIRTENKELLEEKGDLEQLLGSERRQWTAIKKQIQALGKQFGKDTPLGKRRTKMGKPSQITVVSAEEFIEKEPVTVVCSSQGWIRAMKGHGLDAATFKYKDGDEERFVFPCQTTDKVVIFASNGRSYTLGADKLPSGRGFGEPVRLMIEMPPQDDILGMFVYNENDRYLVAGDDGRGFIVKAVDCIAQTKNGKIILNTDEGGKMAAATPIAANHTHVASIGTNRKLVVFPLVEVPEMARGKGVTLQKYQGAKLSDILTFAMSEGMPYADGRGSKKSADGKLWLASRASQGKLPPEGFRRDNRFKG
ncbi:MAG: DNA topoisomerase IV subunit A [Alphaproteobacteria bacterium]|nr:DNA topoisomerase IV subunit A [Alphaproteobacteria bacterium]